MKLRALLVLGLIASSLLTGCAINSGSNVPRANGNYEQLAANARTYQKADGNLPADYPLDLLLNGANAREQKPVMALPQNNPR